MILSCSFPSGLTAVNIEAMFCRWNVDSFAAQVSPVFADAFVVVFVVAKSKKHSFFSFFVSLLRVRLIRSKWHNNQ